MSEVTRILEELKGGDRRATDRLLSAVYDELRRLAARELARVGHESASSRPRTRFGCNIVKTIELIEPIPLDSGFASDDGQRAFPPPVASTAQPNPTIETPDVPCQDDRAYVSFVNCIWEGVCGSSTRASSSLKCLKPWRSSSLILGIFFRAIHH